MSVSPVSNNQDVPGARCMHLVLIRIQLVLFVRVYERKVYAYYE